MQTSRRRTNGSCCMLMHVAHTHRSSEVQKMGSTWFQFCGRDSHLLVLKHHISRDARATRIFTASIRYLFAIRMYGVFVHDQDLAKETHPLSGLGLKLLVDHGCFESYHHQSCIQLGVCHFGRDKKAGRSSRAFQSLIRVGLPFHFINDEQTLPCLSAQTISISAPPRKLHTPDGEGWR